MSPRHSPALAFCLGVFVLAAVTSAQERPEETPAESPEYVIGIEDRLSISVWRESDLSQAVNVRPDGKITFPLIGDIKAAGRTPRALDEEVTAALSRFIKEPIVTVVVEEINNFRVFVIGEVHTQGQLVLRQQTRLLQAIALAGGLTQYADKSSVILVREEGGKENRLRVDYRKIVSGDKPELNYFLKPGETIIVN